METITVLYQIAEDPPGSSKNYHQETEEHGYNAFELSIFENKEILLFDVLKYLLTYSPLGINYLFYLDESEEFGMSIPSSYVLLPSPSCSLPIINGCVTLYLQAVSYFPFTPIEQTLLFYDKYQVDFFGDDSHLHYSPKEKKQYTNTSDSKIKKYKKQDRPPVSSSSFTQHSNSFSSTGSASSANRRPQPRKEVAAPVTRNVDYDEDPADSTAYDTRTSFNSAPNSSSDSREHHHRKKSSQDSVFSEDPIATITNVAGVASQVGLKAAGSLFKFASSTIQNVVSVTTQQMTDHIQIGKHKVFIVKELAEGGFSKVYLVKEVPPAKNPQANTPVYAMKTIISQTAQQSEEALNELRMLQRFHGHPNIIELIEHTNVAQTTKGKTPSNVRQFHFLFPAYNNGTCWDLIEKLGEGNSWPFPERLALQIMEGTCRALEAIHDSCLIHLDIKPHNILLSDDMKPVLMDLGSMGPFIQVNNRKQAKLLEEEAAVKCSAPYRAPELTEVPSECSINYAADMWSLGCTMYCLAFGRSPFESPREGVLRLAILNGKFSYPPSYSNQGVRFSNGYIELINLMLQLDYNARPTAHAVKSRVKELLAETVK